MSQSFLSTFHGDVVHARLLTHIKFVLRRALKYLLMHKKLALIAVCGSLIMYATSSAIYQPTSEMNFSSAGSCVKKLTILPGIHKTASNSQFGVSFEGGLSLFGAQFGAQKVCAQPKDAISPQAVHTVSYSPFGLTPIGQRMLVATDEYPVLKTESLKERTIAANRPLKLELEDKDAVFDYMVNIEDHALPCKKQEHHVTCDLDSAKLKQGEVYNLEVVRMFGRNEVESLFSGDVRTAEPLTITASSIVDNQTIYEPVTSIKISGSHELKDQSEVRVIAGDTQANHSVAVEGSDAFVNFLEPLPWRTSVKIKVESLEATSGATLEDPFELQFTTSGGPKVISSNIANYKVEPSQTFSIGFDQAVGANQSLGSFVSLTGPEGKIEANIYAEGAQIIVRPSNSLNRCSSYTLSINSEVKNLYDLAGDSSWRHTFKSSCAIVSSIGSSVQGRSVQSHSFGNGSSVIVYVGGMHGTESSGTRTLEGFIDALEQNPDRIPANRRIVIIANSNPDGGAHGTRTNANNVDLNRNFPAHDWQSLVHMPGGVESPNGGGSAALSEPESRALASYIEALSPRLVLTYHAVASVVIGNGSGDSNALAGVYARKTSYKHAYDAQSDETFGYPTTGEFEDWLHDVKGIPALLIELGSSRSNQFSKNQDAMWHMATLP